MLHKCPHCSYSSNYSNNVKRHIDAVHLKLKPHICKHCSKGFGQNSTLLQHIRDFHLGDKKKHQCPRCSKKFQSKSGLKFHIKTVHHREKPCECQHCGQRFSSNQILQRHVNLKHKKMSMRDARPDLFCEHNKRKEKCPTCDPKGHLKNNIRTRIHNALKNLGLKKDKPTEEIVGCSFQELHDHLQKKIERWNVTYGVISGVFLNGELQLDHIKPLSTAKNAEEIKQLNHFTNLQWIWKHVNGAKSDIWTEEDEKYWLANIFQNPDYLNIYLPESIWSVVFPTTLQ